MSKRLYLMMALMVLIGAPLIANLMSNAVPAGENPASPANQEPPREAPISSVQHMPPPVTSLPDVTPPLGASANAATDIAPSLDPHGIEPVAVGEVQSVATQISNDGRPAS